MDSISSVLSAYPASIMRVNSAYNSTPVREKQDSSDAKKAFSEYSPNGEINDEAFISDAAKALLEAEEIATKGELSNKNGKEQPENSTAQSDEKTKTDAPKIKEELTTEQKQELVKLKARDAEVKAHEQAHIAAAAGIRASSPSYEYQTGPDGVKYAVGGEVNLSFVQSGDQKANIANARAMKSAALAPSQPSSQDMAVARHAEQIIHEAQVELTKEQSEKVEKPEENADAVTPDDSSKPESLGEASKPDESNNDIKIKAENNQTSRLSEKMSKIPFVS